MRERKNQLVEKYRNHMLIMGLSTNPHYHAEISKENLSMQCDIICFTSTWKSAKNDYCLSSLMRNNDLEGERFNWLGHNTKCKYILGRL